MNKPLLIGVGVVVLLALAGGGYALMRNKDKTATSDTGQTSGKLSDACKYNDPDLCKFINSWKANDYYTVTSETTTNGKKSTTVFKSEGETKSQVTMTTDGKESYNTISIGETTYIKDYSDGKWTKYVSQPNETLEQYQSDYDFDSKAEKAEDKTTYKKIGTEACGELTCFKYQVIDPDSPDVTQYIYFDNKQYQLRKTRTETKEGVFEATFDYAKFSITEPSPIKDASAQSTTTINSQDSEAAKKAAEEALKQLQSQEAPDDGATGY